MFCPVCKYEFRRGFTHCNQCDVDLVDVLPPEEAADHTLQTAAETLDQPTLLWSGANGGIFSALTTALDEAGIPYNKEELDARLVFTSQHGDLEVWVPAANLPEAQPILNEVLANPLNSDPAASAALHQQNELSARAALPADDENEYGSEYEEDATEIRRENAARELFPEEATMEVWRGDDENMPGILKSCLAEIGVPCYIERPHSPAQSDSAYASAHESETRLSSASSTRSRSHAESPADSAGTHPSYAAFVLPEDESSARQIVRSITDATPPQ